jgi:CO/xanthine dehydrogenase FAD-binding subunit
VSVHHPVSAQEAVDARVSVPGALLLAGGTDAMVETNFGHRRYSQVVSLRRCTELARTDVSDDRVLVGSTTPYAELERGPLAEALPALAQAARTVGSPQIRAAGTVGGNIGTASPAGDALPVLAALDASVHVLGPRGERAASVGEIVVGVKRNTIADDEIITGISFPRSTGWQGYAKVGTRNAMVISVVSACLAVDRTGDGTAPRVRLALGAVAPIPLRAHAAEAWLAGNFDPTVGTPPEGSLVDEFARRAAAEARPIDDHRSTAAYRRHAVEVLTRRLLWRAFSPSTTGDQRHGT